MTVTEAEAQVATRERQAIDAVNEAQSHIRAAGSDLRKLLSSVTDEAQKHTAKQLLARLESLTLEPAATLTDRLTHARVQALRARAGIAEAALAAHAAAMAEVRDVNNVKAQLEATQPPAPPRVPLIADAALWNKEERYAPRVTLQAAIDYASDSNLYTGFTTDVSEGGVFIATVEHQPIGTRVEVAFTLPTGQIIHAQGEVRWIRDYDNNAPTSFPGMGIRFLGLRQSDAAVLHQFVAEREPMFYPD